MILIAVALVGATTLPIASAEHTEDGTYDQPILFYWWDTDLEVIVVPPTHGQIVNENGVLDGLDTDELSPTENSYMDAIEDGIADWDRAIQMFGPSWLQDGLNLNVYVLGKDDPPQSALEDPEIVVTTAEEMNAYLGVTSAGVEPGDQTCVISNTKMFVESHTYEQMYSISAHEFGHCLGLGHTGDTDGGGTGEDGHPDHDTMEGDDEHEDLFGIQDPGGHLHCISNLNVAGLEAVFAPVLGQPERTAVAHVDVGSYETTAWHPDCWTP